MEASQTAAVTIFGIEYRLRGPEDPTFAHSVAKMVDARMREVADKSHTASQTQVAVLTLLNVAGELVRERQRVTEVEDQTAGRIRELGDRITDIMAGQSPS